MLEQRDEPFALFNLEHLGRASARAGCCLDPPNLDLAISQLKVHGDKLFRTKY